MSFIDLTQKYDLLNKIGEGGMGEVWIARDRVCLNHVAIKRLKKDLSRDKDKKRFYREVEHLSGIRSKNVVSIYDWSEEELWYSMEYCANGALTSCDIVGSRNPKIVASISMQIANGLKALHDANPSIIHRDIKPSNILVDEEGYFKIADLGLSKAEDDTEITTSNWRSNGFAPPEQSYNFKDLNSSADIYSFGAVIYFLLTGTDVRKPPDLSDVNVTPQFAGLLTDMLAFNPADRLSSVDAVIRVLAHIN